MQAQHYLKVAVQDANDLDPREMWLGPLVDPIEASELAKRFRTEFVHSPQVSLHPSAPANAEIIAVDETMLVAHDLVEAVRDAVMSRYNVVVGTVVRPIDGPIVSPTA